MFYFIRGVCVCLFMYSMYLCNTHCGTKLKSCFIIQVYFCIIFLNTGHAYLMLMYPLQEYPKYIKTVKWYECVKDGSPGHAWVKSKGKKMFLSHQPFLTLIILMQNTMCKKHYRSLKCSTHKFNCNKCNLQLVKNNNTPTRNNCRGTSKLDLAGTISHLSNTLVVSS